MAFSVSLGASVVLDSLSSFAEDLSSSSLGQYGWRQAAGGRGDGLTVLSRHEHVIGAAQRVDAVENIGGGGSDGGEGHDGGEQLGRPHGDGMELGQAWADVEREGGHDR